MRADIDAEDWARARDGFLQARADLNAALVNARRAYEAGR